DMYDLQETRLKAAGIPQVDRQFVDTVKEVYRLVNAWSLTLEKEPWTSAVVYDQVIEIEGRMIGVEIIDRASGQYVCYDMENYNRAFTSEFIEGVNTVKIGSVVYQIIPGVETADITLKRLFSRSRDVGDKSILLEGKMYIVTEDAGKFTLKQGSKVYESQNVGGEDVIVIGETTWTIDSYPDGSIRMMKKGSMLVESASIPVGTKLINVSGKLFTVEALAGRIIFSDGEKVYSTPLGRNEVAIEGALYRVEYNESADEVTLRELLPGDLNGDGVVTAAEETALTNAIGQYTAEVKEAGEEALQYVDIGGVRYDIRIASDGTITLAERVVRSSLVETLNIGSDTYMVTVETATKTSEGDMFHYDVLRFTRVSIDATTNSVVVWGGQQYDSSLDMGTVTIGAQTYAVDWPAEGGIQLVDPNNTSVILSSPPAFRLVEIRSFTDEQDALLTTKWLGSNRLRIRGYADSFLVKKEGDRFIFIKGDELTSQDLEDIMLASGFTTDTGDEWNEMKQALEDAFKQANYYYSNTRTNTVNIDGVIFDITEITPGGEVRLTARNAYAGDNVDEIRVIACEKAGDDYVFYGDTRTSASVTQDADGTVIFGDFDRYSIIENAATGAVQLVQAGRDAGSLGSGVFALEVNGVNYAVTDNGDGTYTFTDGVYSYTSDQDTQTVRLGEMLFTSTGRFASGMTEEEKARVRGVLYDIKIDSSGNMELVKHAGRNETAQLIELAGKVYAVTTDYKGDKSILTYPTGVTVTRLASDENTLALEGRTFDVTRDAVTGHISLEWTDGAEIVQSESMMLVRANGVTYSVKETADPEQKYEFFYLGEISASYSTSDGHKVELGTGENILTYNIFIEPSSGMVRLEEDYMKGTAEFGKFLLVGGKTGAYDVGVDTQLETATLSDGVNTYMIYNINDLLDETIDLVIDDTGTVKQYYVIYDPAGENISLTAVTPDGSNDFLASAEKQVVNLGGTWYTIIEESPDFYSFTWTDAFDTTHIRYASLADGEVQLADSVFFDIDKDIGGALYLVQGEYVTSRDVTLYPVSTTPRKILTIAGVEYVLEYEIVKEWSDKIRDPENDVTEGGTKILAYKSGFMMVPRFTLKRLEDGVLYENRKVLEGLVVAETATSDGSEISREDQRFIIDLPEASIGLESYPNLYANAVEIADSQTGEKKLFYISQRNREEGVNSYYLCSEDEQFMLTSYSDTLELDDTFDTHGDLRAEIEIGGEEIMLIIPDGLHPTSAAEETQGYLQEGENILSGIEIHDPDEIYGGRFSVNFISGLALDVTTAEQVSLVECQVDWKDERLLFESGRHSVRQEAEIDGRKYYVYPLGSTLKLDAVHFESVPVYDSEPFDDMNGNGVYDAPEPFTDENDNEVWDEGEEYTDVNENGEYDRGEPYYDENNNAEFDVTTRPNSLYIGIKQYDGSVNVAEAYGYDYEPSPAQDGSVVFTDGFNEYTSDPFTGTVRIAGRTFWVKQKGLQGEDDWTCSLVEVHPVSLKAGMNIINVPMTGKEYRITLQEDGTYVIKDLATTEEYSSAKYVDMDGTLFKIMADADGKLLLEEVKEPREPARDALVSDIYVGLAERSNILAGAFGGVYGTDLFLEDSYSVKDEDEDTIIRVISGDEIFFAVFDADFGLPEFTENVKDQIYSVYGILPTQMNVELLSVSEVENAFNTITSGNYEPGDAPYDNAQDTLRGLTFNDMGPGGIYISGRDSLSGVENGYRALSVIKGDYFLKDFEYYHSAYGGYSNEWLKNYDAMLLTNRYAVLDYEQGPAGYLDPGELYIYTSDPERALDPLSNLNGRDYISEEEITRIERISAPGYRTGFRVAGKDFDLVKDASGEYKLVEKHTYSALAQDDLVARVEFVGDSGTGPAGEERFGIFDGTFMEDAFIDHMKAEIEGAYTVSGVYTVTTYSLDEIRSVYASNPADGLIAGLGYSDTAGEVFFIGDDRYRVIENTVGAAGETMVVREKYTGTPGEYDAADYAVSTPLQNVFKAEGEMFKAVDAVDPLQGQTGHEEWEKYYFEIYDETGALVTTTDAPAEAGGVWTLTVEGRTYDVTMDELSGMLL
ncbi:MAG: hypothetical protein PVH45_01920, partial [Candidatus Omnitrophota bacterium]